MAQQLNGHAVVLGASMGGLLAARALSESFERVTLVERDAFPAFGEHRKGVPQSKHAHGLLAGGARALEALFPGLKGELIAHGAQHTTLGGNFWVIRGHRLAAFESSEVTVCCSRPMLEAKVRRRVLSLPQVRVLERHDGLGLLHRGGRVTGVRILGRRDDSSEELLEADFVVDATGRGSHLPRWLEALGYPPPQEERVRVKVTYVSALYRRRPEDLQGRTALVIAAAPPNRRCGVALAIDRDHWIVTLPGYLGDYAEPTHEGMLAFAQKLPSPALYELLKHAEPRSEVVPAKFPESTRKRYERLARHPEGLIAFGDALCSFNPIFGQGMSVCALEALALRGCLEGGLDGLWKRFYARASALIEVPWSTAVSNDLSFEEVEGPRTLGWKLLNRYITRVLEVAAYDPVVASAFVQVTNMLAAPPSLMAPRVLGRVLLGSLRRAAPRKALAADASASLPHG